MRVKCLAQEHNTMSPARARTRTARSGEERTNREATAPPTLNVSGLRNAGKKAIFSYLKDQNASIFCLLETFSKKDDENGLENGVGKLFFSHGTEHARGVCVMVNPNSLFQVESVEIDREGRFNSKYPCTN